MRRCETFLRCVGRGRQRDTDGKSRPSSFLAGHGNPSLHTRYDALGDRESESRAAEFPGGRVVSLLEVEKYARDVFILQTDARVAYLKTDFILVIALFGDDRNPTLFGKLDRVADKVEQNLSQACDIANHLNRQSFVDI